MFTAWSLAALPAVSMNVGQGDDETYVLVHK